MRRRHHVFLKAEQQADLKLKLAYGKRYLNGTCGRQVSSVNTFVLTDPAVPKVAARKNKATDDVNLRVELATLVVAYGISINLVEVTWKSKLKAQYPTPNEYPSFMGDFSTCT
ncbi:ADP TP carrier protein 1 [Nymphaea thermarum]|nr:ADP TP carrier protein 1 [Nymphaea thermarum]